MPREGQRTVTLPTWVWEMVKKEFEEKKDYYTKLGVKSPTKLIQIWLLQHIEVKV